MLKVGADGKNRCFGNGANSELYARYHDDEWGRPVYDDQKLFECLILEGAQAGLSWETVLKKREGYREVFHNFDLVRVAAMNDADLETALLNPGIIRNRLKVFSARKNAKAFMDLQREYGSFSNFLWAFVDGKQIINHWQSIDDVPASTALSDRISKHLKKSGMSFVGTTIIYAFLQAVGVVDDHVAACWRRSG